MTRINVVPPEELHRLQLLAEYRELPRVFTLAYQAHLRGADWQRKQPTTYTFGPGHVMFFYDKLLYLSKRQNQLVRELKRRGYDLNFTEDLRTKWKSEIPRAYWKNYAPTEEAMTLNWERIAFRMKGKHWWIKDLPFFI